MSKFYNISFVVLTFINFLSIIALYILLHKRGTKIESTNVSNKIHIDKIIIETKLGKIAGMNKKINSTTKISIFLGIPYAEAPIGKLRFKEPVPKNKFNKTYEAFKWPNPCIQPDQSLQLYNLNFSEDCLYLNIWAPGLNEDKKRLRPVIVVIHTGAFIFGSASESKYNGIFLSKSADVVVVVFNYRLNFYGFFYSKKHKVTSNLGMLDQISALNWIHENIELFNGDPTRITLVGQSSAALSVGMHIISPNSQNLFSRAILMSGSPLQMNEIRQSKQVEMFWKNYILLLKCDYNVKFQELIKCMDSKIKENRNNLIGFQLVKQIADDKLFVNIPIVLDDSFPKNSIKMDLPILFGYTNDEGSWISMLENPILFGPHLKNFLSHSQALEQSEYFLNQMSIAKSINKTKIIDHYLFEMEKFNESFPAKTNRMITNILGDRYIICPMEMFADLILKSDHHNSLVYQYYWQYKGNPRTSAFWNTFSRVWCGNWMGSCHSFEMFAMFGTPFLEPILFNHEDRIISMKTIQIIKYFAHNGKLFWPHFQNNQKLFYNMDPDDDEFTFGYNLKHIECNQIWNSYLL